MDGFLFDPIEFTDPGIIAVMKGHTCRQCDHRINFGRGHFYCSARKSGRTNNGYLRVRSDQPACILFTIKQ